MERTELEQTLLECINEVRIIFFYQNFLHYFSKGKKNCQKKKKRTNHKVLFKDFFIILLLN